MRQKAEDMMRKLIHHFLNGSNTDDFDDGNPIQIEESLEKDDILSSNGPNFISWFYLWYE